MHRCSTFAAANSYVRLCPRSEGLLSSAPPYRRTEMLIVESSSSKTTSYSWLGNISACAGKQKRNTTLSYQHNGTLSSQTLPKCSSNDKVFLSASSNHYISPERTLRILSIYVFCPTKAELFLVGKESTVTDCWV